MGSSTDRVSSRDCPSALADLCESNHILIHILMCFYSRSFRYDGRVKNPCVHIEAIVETAPMFCLAAFSERHLDFANHDSFIFGQSKTNEKVEIGTAACLPPFFPGATTRLALTQAWDLQPYHLVLLLSP